MTQELERPLAPRPDHVPAELVRQFDLYNMPGASEDVHEAFAAVQAASPDIFWTPYNGGHWVATRAEDIMAMQADFENFSNRGFVIPPMPEGAHRQVPLELDPPEHAPFRRPLTAALLPAQLAKLDAGVCAVAVESVERLVPLGECEFIRDFAKVMPIHIFLHLVEIPLDDKAYLLELAEDSVRGDAETRFNAHKAMHAYLLKWIRARREKPGEDLLSKLINADIRGERISEDDAISYCTSVLFGGLDTVASMLGFIARYLAQNPEHRHLIVSRLDDEPFLKAVIETAGPVLPEGDTALAGLSYRICLNAKKPSGDCTPDAHSDAIWTLQGAAFGGRGARAGGGATPRYLANGPGVEMMKV